MRRVGNYYDRTHPLDRNKKKQLITTGEKIAE